MQPNAITVQGEINNALATILQTSIETMGSGRTDSGVHAKEQVFHIDLHQPIAEETLLHKMNGILAADIVVNNILPVNNDAHARFNAISRDYEYHIHFKKSPFCLNEYHYLKQMPDFELMNKACQLIIGKHDFTSFSKAKTEANNLICTLERAEWQYEDGRSIFYVTANRFLRGMVRAMVGTLLNVGNGKTSLKEFADILDTKDRTLAGQSVPPQGLYLCNVRYSTQIFIK